MTRPHPRLVGALSIGALLASMAWSLARLSERGPAFDALDAPPAQVPAWRVDLDSASASEIEALPGVGPALAARIVADRAARGGFGGLQGLDRVPGVGPALIERITPFVR